MAHLRSLLIRWQRFRDTAAREILREPNVILFERAAEPLATREGARGG